MRATLLSLVVVVLAAAGTAAAGIGAAPAAILASLNSARAANGLPGRVKENPGWSEKCARHIAYMGSTGTFGHSEDPASPAYSVDGNWAGENSMLARASRWPAGGPFATAPIHLIQLMSPELRQVGIEASSGFVCVTTWPGYDSSSWKKPTVFSVPGDAVGLPHGTPTGFNIMVYAEGVRSPWRLRITAATLTGPGGPVELRTV